MNVYVVMDIDYTKPAPQGVYDTLLHTEEAIMEFAAQIYRTPCDQLDTEVERLTETHFQVRVVLPKPDHRHVLIVRNVYIMHPNKSLKGREL